MQVVVITIIFIVNIISRQMIPITQVDIQDPGKGHRVFCQALECRVPLWSEPTGLVDR